MVFRFFCPQGHILEAELEQAGQPAACPFCGTEMLIPFCGDRARQTESVETHTSQPPPFPDPGTDEAAPLEIAPDAVSLGTDAGAASFPPATGGESKSFTEESPFSGVVASAGMGEMTDDVLHIPCPQGHVLETPRDMLGMAVRCPICQTTFEPQYELSQEYRRKREEMAARAAERAARFWLHLAIGAAILVLGGLIMLIIFAPR